MSRNFHRVCSVALTGAKSRTITGGDSTDLRITFHVFQSTLQTPNAAEIRIFNPSKITLTQFQNKEFQHLVLTAGYDDNMGPIYSGDIKQSTFRHEDAVTTVLTIFCADGDRAYNQAHLSKTLAAGYTPMDVVNECVKAMAPFGISLGLVNVDLSKPAYPRGIPLSLMARDHLRNVALTAGATWSMQQGKLHIVDERKPVPGDDAIVLNSKTGMVGWPEQTEGGIVVRSLLNPAVNVHKKVKIDQSSIQQADPDYGSLTSDVSQRNRNLQSTGAISSDGTYLVYFIERTGDTRGAEWFDVSTCIATGQAPNPSQMQTIPAVGQQAWTLGQN